MSVSTQHICTALQPAQQKPVPLDHSTASPLPLFPWRRRRGEGPEDPYLVSSQRCKFLLGADLGLGKVVLAARLGECSLEERLVCRGGRDGGGEVGDPGMPRWQR